MGSKREEERNEKIIRGLMKLPPNRRCINCNSLGPQYACTNFWTFVCMPCSGIHREFTHRVKSVSMAKFTSEEVDALQKGGNQRARELYLNAWDPQKHRLPDNSNGDKVREFIKNVYVDKKYAVNNSSDRPPKDQQSIRSHEDEMRRANSYHSFSQSPPYDFQYEERRYGKPVGSLTRKPGSDCGLFEGKLSSFSSFSSPSRFSDHANDERFANEGSYPRVFDYSVSSGGDPFRSDVLSPNYQRETWSPFNEISSNLPSEIHGHHTVIHNSDANGGSNAGRLSGPQRTASSGSSGSFDSMSFKPVNSMGLHELEAEAKQSLEISHDKASSFPSPSSSSTSTIFNGLDLFNEPFAPQNFTSTPATVCSSRSPESFLAQSVDLFPQFPISSVPNIVEQQPAQTPQPLPQNGGWATFDASQNLSPVASQNSLPSTVPSSDGNSLEDFNLFSLDKIFSQNSTIYETSTPTHVLWDDCPKNVEPTNSTQLWSAFEDSPGKLPIENVLKDADQATALSTSNANSSLNIGVYEAPTNGGNISSIYENEIEPPSSLVSHSNMMMHDFAILPEMAGVHSVATAHKPTNPFDLCDADFESSDMSQFWDMSALQEALPDNQIQATYIGDTNESWFTQKSVLSYAPDGVTFDPPNEGSLGFVVARAPSAAISNVPAQGPVASIGGNPFA